MITRSGDAIPNVQDGTWQGIPVNDDTPRTDADYVLAYRISSWLAWMTPVWLLLKVAEYFNSDLFGTRVVGSEYDDETLVLRVWVHTGSLKVQQAALSPLAIGAIVLGALAILGVVAAVAESAFYRIKTAAIIAGGGKVVIVENGKPTDGGILQPLKDGLQALSTMVFGAAIVLGILFVLANRRS